LLFCFGSFCCHILKATGSFQSTKSIKSFLHLFTYSWNYRVCNLFLISNISFWPFLLSLCLCYPFLLHNNFSVKVFNILIIVLCFLKILA
jgi:hypothetical protein